MWRLYSTERWLVFVCAMPILFIAGVGYLIGVSMSPAIKTALSYNQKQIGLLGVANNLGDAIGFVSGALLEVSPTWLVLLVGAVQNLVSYGVGLSCSSSRVNYLVCPLWMIHNFSESRGPTVVGILKGFYLMLNPSHDSSVILMVAVGTPAVVLSLLFIVRPVEE